MNEIKSKKMSFTMFSMLQDMLENESNLKTRHFTNTNIRYKSKCSRLYLSEKIISNPKLRCTEKKNILYGKLPSPRHNVHPGGRSVVPAK